MLDYLTFIEQGEEREVNYINLTFHCNKVHDSVNVAFFVA